MAGKNKKRVALAWMRLGSSSGDASRATAGHWSIMVGLAAVRAAPSACGILCTGSAMISLICAVIRRPCSSNVGYVA